MADVEFKECEVKLEKEIFLDENVEFYCRSCFQIFTLNSHRNELSSDFLSYIQDIFPSNISLQGGSRWICVACKDTIEKFWKFQKDFKVKQEKFQILIERGEHQIFSKIQELLNEDVPYPEEVLIKEEELNELPAIEVIKLPEHPATEVIESPAPSTSSRKRKATTPQQNDEEEPPQKRWTPHANLFNRKKYSDKTFNVLPKISTKVKKCNFCRKHVKDMPGHLNKDHGQNNIFRCSGCDFTAPSRRKVQTHIRHIHLKLRATYKYKCEVCKNVVSDINKHYPLYHEGVGKKHSCNICGITSYVAEAIKDHKKKFHEEPEKVEEVEKEIIVLPKCKSTRCEKCCKYFKDIVAHRHKKHGRPLKYSCSACDFTAESRGKVSWHIEKIHRAQEKQACPYCGLLFYWLNHHIASTHEQKKNYFCDLCDFSSYRKNSLHSHMLNCHLPKTVCCTKCDFKTINKSRLRKHEDNQHAETEKEKFRCPVTDCEYGLFRNKSYLEVHIRRVHRRELTVKCASNDCTKMFFSEGQMWRHHQNTHGPRNFLCPSCGAAFGSDAHLKSHISYMHAEKNFECEHCHEKFYRQSKLDNHIRVAHTFERPFKCEFENCSAGYYAKPRLERHMEEKHYGIKYDCQAPGCDASFIRVDNYRKHLSTHKELTDDQHKELQNKLKLFREEIKKK